ncbi:dihydroorotase [Tepidibacillus fermentans]|uniref:Dihydroorotase n=2 Tax=Tepidibacillus fermentans TaxID=1281767 RepID=A0A4R3KLS2_9BACI|nr:dihydroorotase [Tepidibacillus fermentans]
MEDQIVYASGKIVVPGFIDVHVHLREPGYEEKETIKTGAKAAVKGGFTTIASMPNTKPVIDQAELITYVLTKSEQAGFAKVLPIGAITKKQEGQELADLFGMKEKGAVGFSDDGRGVKSSGLMKQAMEIAKTLGVPILAHCEDIDLTNGGVIHDGRKANELGVPGIPAEAEYIQLARDLILAEITGVHYHVCHVSSKRSVELIREAKARGVNVTVEVTPHHLVLTEDDLKEPYSQFKMNPPLRTEEDRQALIKGLKDGTIDMIATDHAPHTEQEKGKGLLEAPFGIVGLEIAFPLLFTNLVKHHLISLEQLIDSLTIKPASLLGLTLGKIEKGSIADITVIDLEKIQSVDPTQFVSKGKNTPFFGWKLQGWPVMTIVNGKIVWEEKEE